MMKTTAILGVLVAATISMPFASAAPLGVNDPDPHFFVVMENQTNQDVSISFKVDAGHVNITPSLSDHTPLPAHQSSQQYGIIYPVVGNSDVFSMIFTGKQDCAISVEFFSPGNPKLTISGYGCNGVAYRVVGDILYLTATGINLKTT